MSRSTYTTMIHKLADFKQCPLHLPIYSTNLHLKYLLMHEKSHKNLSVYDAHNVGTFTDAFM